jgi:hypothetical protein
MFPPTVCTVILKKKKSLHCINLQCNKDCLGNELIAFPDKTKETGHSKTLKMNIFKNVGFKRFPTIRNGNKSDARSANAS